MFEYVGCFRQMDNRRGHLFFALCYISDDLLCLLFHLFFFLQ